MIVCLKKQLLLIFKIYLSTCKPQLTLALSLFSLSFYTTKDFDSINWLYHWAVLAKFEFRELLNSWVKLLYQNLRAANRKAGKISSTFEWGRGNKARIQTVFALAIEPLVTLIRSNSDIVGYKYTDVYEKMRLYTEDVKEPL